MTIVCATRFSEESQHAVNAAVSLARRRNEPLCLVHVMSGGMLQAFSKQLADSAKTALDDEVLRLSKSGVTVTGELLTGKVGEALAKFCAQKDARLLVVGDTAKKATNLLAGSLDKLAYSVEAPLLVVRDERPFERWAEGKPLRVLLAFDRTESSAVARDWVSRLTEYGPIELVATQIYWPIEEYEERQLKPEEGHLALVGLMQKELEGEFAKVPPSVKVSLRCEMGTGNIANQLLAIAGEEQVDLMLLGTHRRRALGRLFSVSHTIVLQAPMAVACVPSTTTVPHLSRSPAWKTGLVATDFTESGSRAVAWAATLLRPGSTLHVVHVSPERFSAEREVALVKRLSATLPVDVEQNGLKVVAHVLHGEPEDVLRTLINTVDADVLVIGAKSLPEDEIANEGVIIPEINDQWRLVQTLLETTHRPVLLTPPMRA